MRTLLVLIGCLLLASVASAQVSLSEVYYSTPGNDLQLEYVELMITGPADINGWTIATLDDDNETLPFVANLGAFDYVVIHPGIGVQQLDAINGSAVIYLGRATEMLDGGDEVILYDAAGNVVDFMRYAGGNGDPVVNWPGADPGPAAQSSFESVQMHGVDEDSSSNWVSAPLSETNPNVYPIMITTPSSAVEVWVQNGVKHPLSLPDAVRGINFTVVNVSPGVSVAELKILEGMMNFSYNFYKNRSFNEPEVGPDGIMNVTVTKTNRFNAATRPNGDISIDLGGNLSDPGVAAFTKWTMEHEFLHTIQFGRFYPNGTHNSSGPYNYDTRTPGGRFAFLLDGLAEYWGLEIAKAQFNVTDEHIFNISLNLSHSWPTFSSIPYNFSTILGDFDFSLPRFTTGNLQVYTHGYLFMRFIADRYGEGKLIHFHNVSRNNITGSGNDVIGQDVFLKAFEEQGINTTLQDLFINWTIWIYTNRSANLGYVFDGVFNGAPTGDANTLHPWGTDFERITLNKSNFRSEGPYGVDFKDGTGNFSMTIITKKGSDTTLQGMTKFIGNTSVNVTGDFDEIILIKSRFGSFAGGVIAYNVSFYHTGIINSSVRNVTLTNGSLVHTNVNESTLFGSGIVWSNVSGVNVSLSEINHSDVSSSNVSNASLIGTLVSNSSIEQAILLNVTSVGSVIQSTNLSNVSVIASFIANSTIINSTIINSTIVNSVKINAVVINSVNRNSYVENSQEINSSVTNGTLVNSSVTGSSIQGGSVTGCTIASILVTSPLVCSLPTVTQLTPTSIGTFALFELSDPAHPNAFYQFAWSGGTSPGIVVPGVGVVPLNYDPIFQVSYHNPLAIGLLNSFGILDSNGNAIVQQFVPFDPSWIGFTVYGAFVTYDPSAPFGIGSISQPVTATITQ